MSVTLTIFRQCCYTLLVALLSPNASLSAATNSAERTVAFAKLPDWRGTWKLIGSTVTIDDKLGTRAVTNAPYNAEWQTKYAVARAAVALQRDSYERFCYAGVPRMMASPELLMFVLSPEETVVLGSRHDIRHLWADGRAHTPVDEMWPMFWGDSIAHWEGLTLVVDTISLKGDLWLDPTGANLSDEMRVTERTNLGSKGRLRNEKTIVDPVALTKPWTFAREFARTTLDDLPEEDCQWTAGSAGRLRAQQ